MTRQIEGATNHQATLNRTWLLSSVIFFASLVVPKADAEMFGGVEFPNGVSSFADQVVLYDCAYNGGGGGGTCPTSHFNPLDALGPPDSAFTSIGLGGLLELGFTDNVLTNSGDSSEDLWIFEIGADTEGTSVAVRPTAETLALPGFTGTEGVNGFYQVGSAGGSTDGVDIDAFFPGFSAGELRFDAVQLVDEDYDPGTSAGTHGADITAVGAISTTSVVPIPSAIWLLGAGLAGLIRKSVRRSNADHLCR